MTKLTDAKLRTLKEPGKHSDGGGMYLEITPSGGRYWRMKYRYAGKEKRLAFGVYPAVTLKEARERRDAARKLLEQGQDPSAVAKAEKERTAHEAETTFQRVAGDWISHNGARWAQATQERISQGFKADVYPLIGDRPIAKVTPREVAAVIKGIEARGAGETASRTLQRVRAVFRYAMAHEVIERNPMTELMPGELLKPRQVRHRAALPAQELPAFLAALDGYTGDPTTKNCLALLMLTAVRPGEARGAQWDEFDLEAAAWLIPAARMKMKAAHTVPLSSQAVRVLEDQKRLTGGRPLVFQSPYHPSKSLSENTLNSALARMGFKGIATAHGFRALFSTVANECGHDADVIERQLAHKERDAVRAAYHRSTYIEARTQLMQWWADFIDGNRTGQVIGFRREVGKSGAGA